MAPVGNIESASLSPDQWANFPDDLIEDVFKYLITPSDLSAGSRVCHGWNGWRDLATPRLAELHHERYAPRVELLQQCVEPYASSEVAPAEDSHKRRRVAAPESDTQRIVGIATRVLGQPRVQQIIGDRDPRSFPVLDRLYREVLDVFICSSIGVLMPIEPELPSWLPTEEMARELCALFNLVGEEWEIDTVNAGDTSAESIESYYQSGCIKGPVLRMIPPQVQCFPDLQTLNLSANALTMSAGDVEALLSLPNLQNLIFSNNSLREIPFSFSGLTRLRYLDLSWNQLSDLPPLDEMRELERLDLQGNKFVNVPLTIQLLPNLQVLDISGNPIRFEDFANLMVSFAIQGRAGIRVVVNRNLVQDPQELRALRGAIESWEMDLQITIPSHGGEVVVCQLR